MSSKVWVRTGPFSFSQGHTAENLFQSALEWPTWLHSEYSDSWHSESSDLDKYNPVCRQETRQRNQAFLRNCSWEDKKMHLVDSDWSSHTNHSSTPGRNPDFVQQHLPQASSVWQGIQTPTVYPDPTSVSFLLLRLGWVCSSPSDHNPQPLKME